MFLLRIFLMSCISVVNAKDEQTIGSIASGNLLATKAGLEVLEKGGNASKILRVEDGIPTSTLDSLKKMGHIIEIGARRAEDLFFYFYHLFDRSKQYR